MSTAQMETIETNKKVKKTKTKSSKDKSETKIDLSEESSIIVETNDSNPVQSSEKKEETVLSSTSEEVEIEAQEDNSEEVSISSDKEEYMKKMTEVIEAFTFLNNKSLKEYDLTKDFFTFIFKNSNKISKLQSAFIIGTNDWMLKETAASLKKKSIGKKVKKTNENCAIKKEADTYPEILQFMKLPENTKVSNTDVLRAINAFVKIEKSNNNPDIWVYKEDGKVNGKSFKLIGDLKILFDFIRKQKVERDDMKSDDKFPTQLKYTDIMSYLKYCFKQVIKQ